MGFDKVSNVRWTNIIAGSRNHCYSGKPTILSLCILEPHVIVNNTETSNVVRRYLYSEFMSRDNNKTHVSSCRLPDIWVCIQTLWKAGNFFGALYHKLYTQSSSPEDGRNYRPKHVELIEIINKLLLLHLVGCLYHYELRICIAHNLIR